MKCRDLVMIKSNVCGTLSIVPTIKDKLSGRKIVKKKRAPKRTNLGSNPAVVVPSWPSDLGQIITFLVSASSSIK